MSGRLRLVGWEVRPVVMVDDGEQLVPLPVEARSVLAADWPEFKSGGDERALDRLREQVEHLDVSPPDVNDR